MRQLCQSQTEGEFWLVSRWNEAPTDSRPIVHRDELAMLRAMFPDLAGAVIRVKAIFPGAEVKSWFSMPEVRKARERRWGRRAMSFSGGPLPPAYHESDD